MIELTTATWSAIAASFSALSAFIVMRIQRRTFLEAARPELVIEGWRRDSDDEVRLGVLRNVGKGIAFNVTVNASYDDDLKRPLYSLPTLHWPLLPPGESVKVDEPLFLWWQNVGGDSQHLPVKITIHAWDARERRHVTTYTFLVVRQSEIRQSNAVAPGVFFPTRRVSTSIVWRLKLAQLPGRLGRRFKAKLPRVTPREEFPEPLPPSVFRGGSEEAPPNGGRFRGEGEGTTDTAR